MGLVEGDGAGAEDAAVAGAGQEAVAGQAVDRVVEVSKEGQAAAGDSGRVEVDRAVAGLTLILVVGRVDRWGR